MSTSRNLSPLVTVILSLPTSNELTLSTAAYRSVIWRECNTSGDCSKETAMHDTEQSGKAM